MKNNIRLSLALIFIFIAIIMVGFVNKLTAPRILSNEELLINGFYRLREPIEISDFRLEKNDGTFFTKSDLNDKWTIMYFGFTSCPSECPVTMSELRKLINALREKDFKLSDKQWVLVTIDPERDSAADIDFYASRFDPEFIGLRGDRATLLSLTTQLNVAKVQPMKHEMHDIEELSDHINNIVFINKDAQYFGFFRPPFEMSKLSLTYQSITTQ
tara:strand:- start:126 stop:770 length:645 start_codon:yes stop_codon:yes gene_type:complete